MTNILLALIAGILAIGFVHEEMRAVGANNWAEKYFIYVLFFAIVLGGIFFAIAYWLHGVAESFGLTI